MPITYNLSDDYNDWMKYGHGNRSQINIKLLQLWDTILTNANSNQLIDSAVLLEDLMKIYENSN